MGGGRSKNFTEGWVEFEDKAEAKHVRVGGLWVRGWSALPYVLCPCPLALSMPLFNYAMQGVYGWLLIFLCRRSQQC